MTDELVLTITNSEILPGWFQLTTSSREVTGIAGIFPTLAHAMDQAEWIEQGAQSFASVRTEVETV